MIDSGAGSSRVLRRGVCVGSLHVRIEDEDDDEDEYDFGGGRGRLPLTNHVSTLTSRFSRKDCPDPPLCYSPGPSALIEHAVYLICLFACCWSPAL
jgi:hypothetical protein